MESASQKKESMMENGTVISHMALVKWSILQVTTYYSITTTNDRRLKSTRRGPLRRILASWSTTRCWNYDIHQRNIRQVWWWMGWTRSGLLRWVGCTKMLNRQCSPFFKVWQRSFGLPQRYSVRRIVQSRKAARCWCCIISWWSKVRHIIQKISKLVARFDLRFLLQSRR